MSVPTSIDRLQSERLQFERLRSDHLDDLVTLLTDPRVSRWIWPRSYPPTDEDIRRSLADKIGHWERYGFGMWLVRDRATGAAVGRGGLQWTYLADLHEVEAGWAIVPDRWGEGLGTELALTAVEAAFGSLRLQEIIAFALANNRGSRRVMEKAGFAYDRDLVHAGLPHVRYRRRR